LTSIDADFGSRAQAAITKLFGATQRESPAAYRRGSPIGYVAPGKPPILMVHGDGDTLPFEQSKRMLEACQRAGLAARRVKVGNANHDFELVDPKKPLSIGIEQIHALTVEFFKDQLSIPFPKYGHVFCCHSFSTVAAL
jgi:dipeptidyl aminopeptidase/acylaminoacyl peptidase